MKSLERITISGLTYNLCITSEQRELETWYSLALETTDGDTEFDVSFKVEHRTETRELALLAHLLSSTSQLKALLAFAAIQDDEDYAPERDA